MESQDPRDINDYRETRRLYGKGRMTAIVVVLALLVMVVALLVHPDKMEKAAGVVQAVAAPSQPAVPEPKTDPELKLQNSELKKQVSTLTDTVKAKDATIKEKDAAMAVKEKQAQATEKVLADVTSDRDKYRDLYNNGPLYWDRMNKAQGWHLHFGGMVSNPVDFGGFKVDPTVTLLAGVGPERWQVLVGLGGNIDAGLSVSIGFMWTMGDIGREKRKK